MEKINHDLAKEKRLIEWLGYSLVDTDNPNLWNILDENQNQVGQIRSSQVMHVNSDKFVTKYETFIDSPTITYKCSRDLNDDESIFQKNYYSYSFMLKKDNINADFVEIYVGSSPSISIWSKDYGHLYFSLSSRGMHVNVKNKTDRFDIDEVLDYKNFVHDEFKEYAYKITYHRLDAKMHNGEFRDTTREITANQYPNCLHSNEKNKLRITEKTWVGHTIKDEWKAIVDGSVQELASKNQMGIDCFNYFRFLANKIVPFKSDVLYSIVGELNIKLGNLGLFFQDIEKEPVKTIGEK